MPCFMRVPAWQARGKLGGWIRRVRPVPPPWLAVPCTGRRARGCGAAGQGGVGGMVTGVRRPPGAGPCGAADDRRGGCLRTRRRFPAGKAEHSHADPQLPPDAGCPGADGAPIICFVGGHASRLSIGPGTGRGGRWTRVRRTVPGGFDIESARRSSAPGPPNHPPLASAPGPLPNAGASRAWGAPCACLPARTTERMSGCHPGVEARRARNRGMYAAPPGPHLARGGSIDRMEGAGWRAPAAPVRVPARWLFLVLGMSC